jgi:hypothetical protein
MKHKEDGHMMKHSRMGGHAMHDGHTHGENVTEPWSHPPIGSAPHMMGCGDFKGEADPIAYGQAGGPLYAKDEGRIHSQFKHYHWDGGDTSSGY